MGILGPLQLDASSCGCPKLRQATEDDAPVQFSYFVLKLWLDSRDDWLKASS